MMRNLFYGADMESAPTGGVWLREHWCDAADKNHPALRAPLLTKEGSLGRCSCGLYQGEGSGLSLQLGMVFINHEGAMPHRAVYHRR